MKSSRNLAVLIPCVVFCLSSVRTAFPDDGPDHWRVVTPPGGLYEVGLDSVQPHRGQRSAFIRTDTEDTETFGGLDQAIAAARYRGHRVRFSAYARSAGVELWAGLWMRVDGTTTAMLAFDNMHNRPITGTTPWERYEIVLDVPEEAARITLGALLAGRGHVWIDDVALEIVGSDVETTDLGSEPTPRSAASDTDLPQQPLNPGFED